IARSRWWTILNGSSRPRATSASPIRGATHSGSISRASRKLASPSSRRPRLKGALPTASMASGFSGAASRACSKRARASSIKPSLAKVSPCSRNSSYSMVPLNQIVPDTSVYNLPRTRQEEANRFEEPARAGTVGDPVRGSGPLRPRQQRRLPRLLRAGPVRLLGRPGKACRDNGARGRRRPRSPVRDRRNEPRLQGPHLFRQHTPRRRHGSLGRQPLLRHELRAPQWRELRARRLRLRGLRTPRLFLSRKKGGQAPPRLVPRHRSRPRRPPGERLRPARTLGRLLARTEPLTFGRGNPSGPGGSRATRDGPRRR